MRCQSKQTNKEGYSPDGQGGLGEGQSRHQAPQPHSFGLMCCTGYGFVLAHRPCTASIRLQIVIQFWWKPCILQTSVLHYYPSRSYRHSSVLLWGIICAASSHNNLWIHHSKAAFLKKKKKISPNSLVFCQLLKHSDPWQPAASFLLLFFLFFMKRNPGIYLEGSLELFVKKKTYYLCSIIDAGPW